MKEIISDRRYARILAEQKNSPSVEMIEGVSMDQQRKRTLKQCRVKLHSQYGKRIVNEIEEKYKKGVRHGNL